MKILSDATSEVQNLKYIDALFVDTCGSLRGKRVPVIDVLKIEKGRLNIPQGIFSLSITGEALDGGGRGISDGDPDGYGYPIDSTFSTIPWSLEPAAQVLMGMCDAAGRPVAIDPRQVLEGVWQAFKSAGMWVNVAFELEFYLLDKAATLDASSTPQAVSTVNLAGGCFGQSYGVEILDKYQAFLASIDAYAATMGIPTRAVSAESGIGQFEINLTHVDCPVQAADHAVLLKQIVKRAAEQHGFEATFMAKPFSEQPGSGMHVHMSIVDADGNNLFASSGNDELLKQCIAGLHALTPACMPIFAPNFNAFRRFVPGNFVPVNRSWGYDNRSVAFRVPAGDRENLRIEHRIAGADANPLLVMAAILSGALHGIANKLTPEPPTSGNNNISNDADFPRNFIDALDLMAADTKLKHYLGEHYPGFYVDLKKKEFSEFLSNYSALEYQWYL